MKELGNNQPKLRERKMVMHRAKWTVTNAALLFAFCCLPNNCFSQTFMGLGVKFPGHTDGIIAASFSSTKAELSGGWGFNYSSDNGQTANKLCFALLGYQKPYLGFGGSYVTEIAKDSLVDENRSGLWFVCRFRGPEIKEKSIVFNFDIEYGKYFSTDEWLPILNFGATYYFKDVSN